MKRRALPAAAALPAVVMAVTVVMATLVALPAGAEPLRRSGLLDMSPALQALQRDDTQNPALLWLKSGEQRFAADCARCHEPAGPPHGRIPERAARTDPSEPAAMRGVATRYPAWDAKAGRPLTLSGRINACRVQNVKAPAPWPPESDELIALETYIARASRGQPITPPASAEMDRWRARGEALWRQPFGQLALSCTQCHDSHAGGKLAGSTIPQAHPTGYPIYRLEWQGMGSLQRRIRNCMSGVRAEPFSWNSDEMTALETYLMQRAAGMPLETPAVRP